MLIDTNCLSAWADGDKSLEKILLKEQKLYVPAIVLGEYRFGLLGSKEKSEREKWLLSLLSKELKILSVDEETAIQYSKIRYKLKLNGTPIPENDVWISGIAKQYSFKILSKDKHFDYVDSQLRVSW